MAKVLFIYPSLGAQEGFNHGIAALSGALKAAGAQTRLIHLNEALYGPVTLDEIAEEVVRFDPHLICFSVMSQQYKYALKIARELKARFPFPIALGGVHATMVPEAIAQCGVFDYIGLGECDDALPALVRAIRDEKDVTSVPNFWVKTDGGYKRNAVGPFPRLESLPPKDYEIFDLDSMLGKMNGWMSMITSRGCPYRCSYCFNHQLFARYREEAKEKPAAYLRRYPTERVIGDMRGLKERHPDIRTFIIDDDLFALNEQAVIEFCEAYKESGIGLPFVVNAHVQVFTPAMARALKAAGCKILKFGVESGSERIRKEVLKRSMSDQAIYDAFNMAHEAGLHTSAFIMIGLPGEERVDLEATLRMTARLNPGRFRWAVFYPFPGTEIHRLCEDDGLIDAERMAKIDNFYEATPLRLAPEQELFVSKLQRALHWYVNSYSAHESADVYREAVEAIDRMDASEWKKRSERFLEEDRRLSDRLAGEGKLHYSIRFIQVMAVRSDYREEEDDLKRPAREWKSTPQQSL
jgi:radical SAM superfamily enzyme YgiQ (UPF0313 family)